MWIGTPASGTPVRSDAAETSSRVGERLTSRPMSLTKNTMRRPSAPALP